MKNFASVLFYLALIISYPTGSRAQSTSRFGNNFNFDFTPIYDGQMSDMRILNIPDTAIDHVFVGIGNGEARIPRSPILLGVKLNQDRPSTMPLPVKSLSKLYFSYFIADGSEGIVVAMGINKNNVGDYLYRVVENDSTEIVPWSKIPKLEQKYGAKQPYGFIGKFQAPGKQLLVEVRNVNNYSIREGVIFDWRTTLKPALQQIGILARINGRIAYGNLKGSAFAKIFDPKTNIPGDFKFKQKEIEQIQLFFDDHFGLPYSIAVRRIDDESSKPDVGFLELEMKENSYMISYERFDYPGKYEILVNRSYDYGPLAKKDELRIPFEVLPRPFQFKKPSTEQVILIAAAILIIGGLIFFRYHKRSKERLQKSAQEKQLAGLKLKSIRSQLNPHFMFNALTSIQNLINKKDMEAANFYLAKFADLTRQVLDSGNEDLISLAEELKLLNDYLQMERLRFNFQYELIIDEALNQANIEIPAMLLQPFAENSVKHGISGMKETGKLIVKMRAEDKDLVFEVCDNGKGFTRAEDSEGYGLKLSEERITLLNQLYKDQPLSLQINAQDTGTTVTIRLSNWLP